MEFDQFELNDPKQFFEELVKKAFEGKQSDFEFIRNFEMIQTARLYKRGVKKVSDVFASLAKGLLRQYSEQIKLGKQDIEALLAAKQFEICRDYYKKEFETAKDMLSEYRTYMFSGHILDTIFGRYRPDEECVDYRTLPFKLF